MNKYFYLVSGLYFIVLFGILFFTRQVFAAEQGSLGAYPTNFDSSNPKTKSWFIYELKQGITKEDSITVVNNSDRSLDVKVYPVDATTTSDGAFALLNEDQRQNDVGSWINMANSTITIEPRGHREVPFTISIPKYATVGDHAGGIVVQEVKKTNVATQGIGLNIVSRIGTRIYENVPGDKVINLDVRDLAYKIVNDRLEFTFTMENQGNVILTPTGRLDLKDQSGKVIDTITLNNLGSIFPRKPTSLTAKLDKTGPLFGQFTATLTINYSPTKAIEKSLQFFILIRDWKLALPVPAILFFIVVLFIFRKLFRKRFNVRQGPQAHKPVYAPVPAALSSVRPEYVPVSVVNVDQLFLSKHIRLIATLTFFVVIVLSGLFAFLLNFFVFSKMTTFATSSAVSLPSKIFEQVVPTTVPTITNTTIDKSKIEVSVLNGSGKTGLAKTVAGKLTETGFTVIRIDNAPENTTQTIIQYPKGELNGANQLMDALKSDYSNIKQQEASGSSQFTIILGL